jgi:hypothetical protein
MSSILVTSWEIFGNDGWSFLIFIESYKDK